jgi:hypothetical protein
MDIKRVGEKNGLMICSVVWVDVYGANLELL